MVFLWCVCYICIACIYAYFIVSSPYLLMFGDDRVRSTHEQMMLQVDLVTLRDEAWASWGDFIELFYYEFYRL